MQSSIYKNYKTSISNSHSATRYNVISEVSYSMVERGYHYHDKESNRVPEVTT